MVEIPVKHKDSREGFPVWLLPLGLLGVLGGGLFFSRACAGPGVVAQRDSEQTPAVAEDTAAERAAASGAMAGCAGDEDCASGQLCSGGSCQALSAAGVCGETRLHFDTDSAAIQDADRQVLDRMARCLRADERVRLLIEGNADQRGTEEHNAMLAEQRAMAVARELTARGVSADQLRVASYGENNPLCQENDEGCWSKNRRTAVHPQIKEADR